LKIIAINGKIFNVNSVENHIILNLKKVEKLFEYVDALDYLKSRVKDDDE
jgi:hypothetical protein